MIRFCHEPRSQARHYKTSSQTPETLINSKEDRRDNIFYTIAKEDKEKHNADKARRDKADAIFDKEYERRKNEYLNTPMHVSGKRPSIFKPNARKEYDEENSRIKKEHKAKKDEYHNFNKFVAKDAINKHMRRHHGAYKEFGIFAECVLI